MRGPQLEHVDGAEHLAQDRHQPGRGVQLRGRHLDQRGLAGAVGTEDHPALVLLDGPGHGVEEGGRPLAAPSRRRTRGRRACRHPIQADVADRRSSVGLRPVSTQLPDAGLVAWWTTSWLRGHVVADQVLDALRDMERRRRLARPARRAAPRRSDRRRASRSRSRATRWGWAGRPRSTPPPSRPGRPSWPPTPASAWCPTRSTAPRGGAGPRPATAGAGHRRGRPRAAARASPRPRPRWPTWTLRGGDPRWPTSSWSWAAGAALRCRRRPGMPPDCAQLAGHRRARRADRRARGRRRRRGRVGVRDRSAARRPASARAGRPPGPGRRLLARGVAARAEARPSVWKTPSQLPAGSVKVNRRPPG